MISNMIARIISNFKDIAGARHLAGDVVEIDHYSSDRLGELVWVRDDAGHLFAVSPKLIKTER